MLTASPASLPPADDDLVRAFRSGDERAFTAIIERHRRAVEAQLRLTLRGQDRSLVEDLAQDVFLRAYVALRRDDRDVILRPWLHTLVRNRSFDELRRPSTVPAAQDALDRPSAAIDPAWVVGRREELRAVLADVVALPPRQRDVLIRHELDGVTHAELAADLGITVAGTKSLANRARETLRRSALARAA